MEDKLRGRVRSDVQQQDNKFGSSGATVWQVLGNGQLKQIYRSIKLVSTIHVSNHNSEFITYLFVHIC
jgi:nitrogen regulatory protein PII